jgi:hypothetical protein
LDYERGLIKPVLIAHAAPFISSVVNGEFKYDMYFQENLKDELRNLDKAGKPRAFKASPLILVILYRFFFGKLMTKVAEQKFTNGIMVGINPLSREWDKFAKRLTGFSPKLFDGDWKLWDGGMITSAQQKYIDLLKAKSFDRNHNVAFNELFKVNLSADEYEKFFDLCCVLLYNTPTISGHDTVITTHSMPSGCAITAFFNSLVNKGYGAYIYWRLYTQKFGEEPLTDSYRRLVYDCVYGDDKITAVKDEIVDWYNGRSFCSIAEEMGLGFTPADKGEWKHDTQDISRCSFLKRTFEFHRGVGQIVGPLEKRSMLSTLNYVSDSFRAPELLAAKLENFQREAYLHENDYESYLDYVIKYVENYDDVDLKIITRKALQKQYLEGEYGVATIFS